MRHVAFVVSVCIGVAGCNARESARPNDPPAVPAPSSSASVPQVDGVAVVLRQVSTSVHLSGELTPYEQVDIHARVNGFVGQVLVDREATSSRGSFW